MTYKYGARFDKSQIMVSGQAKTVHSPRLVAMVNYADLLLRLVPQEFPWSCYGMKASAKGKSQGGRVSHRKRFRLIPDVTPASSQSGRLSLSNGAAETFIVKSVSST